MIKICVSRNNCAALIRLSMDFCRACTSYRLNLCSRNSGRLACTLVAFLLFGCASGTPPGQLSNGSAGPTIYSLTSLYDGEPGSRERAAQRMDIDSRNMCASGSYTRISEESIPTINRLGEATFSRLIWRIECVQTSEQASTGAREGGMNAR